MSENAGATSGVPSDGLRKWGTAKYVGVACDSLGWAGACDGRFGWGLGVQWGSFSYLGALGYVELGCGGWGWLAEGWHI